MRPLALAGVTLVLVLGMTASAASVGAAPAPAGAAPAPAKSAALARTEPGPALGPQHGEIAMSGIERAVVDRAGNLVFTDGGNGRVRMVTR